ncbi:MAG: EutN/CcmL family microcompartment protein [Candidatus Eisenbacteria bacterium]|nr:EutN/CcmL family microcompartment protein [Candidatus Eisenbacteria bacterium]
MHLARVIGAVWATQKVETLRGARMLIVQPLTHELAERGMPVVAVDTVSAAPGQLVFIVKAREAAKALEECTSPVDAAIVGIVDAVSLAGGL